MEEILYVFLFTFFFRCRSFSTWRQLAFPLFLTAVTKLLRFSSNKIGLLWFLSLALALSLLSTLMYTLKLSRKKESAFVAVGFISKRPGSYAIYWRNARVLEMQNFILAYMKGWMYVWTIFSEPKFLGCIDYQFFLLMVVRCARLTRATAPPLISLQENGVTLWRRRQLQGRYQLHAEKIMIWDRGNFSHPASWQPNPEIVWYIRRLIPAVRH